MAFTIILLTRLVSPILVFLSFWLSLGLLLMLSHQKHRLKIQIQAQLKTRDTAQNNMREAHKKGKKKKTKMTAVGFEPTPFRTRA